MPAMLQTIRGPRYVEPVQLELSLFGERSLRAAIGAYMARMTDGLADATLGDYNDRAAWCLQQFGEITPIDAITYDLLDQVVRRHRGVLRNVTLKKRLGFLRAVLKFAQTRGQLASVPALPRLQNDGEVKGTIHTVEQGGVFREQLGAGPFRRCYDLAFWTGQHTADLFTMQRWQLDPDREYCDEGGTVAGRGMFWRRNQKNRRCDPMWLPMEAELVELARAWLDELPKLDNTLVVGRLWNVRRTFHMAADRVQLPRVSPIDLRRSYASMLSGRGWPLEFIRIALGHAGPMPVGWVPEQRMAGRPTIATRHYLQPTPALLAAMGPR